MRKRAMGASIAIAAASLALWATAGTGMAPASVLPSAHAWGVNSFGSAGDLCIGTKETKPNGEEVENLGPSQVASPYETDPPFGRITALAAGNFDSLLKLQSGVVESCGSNQWGLLGDGKTASEQPASGMPVLVKTPEEPVRAIAAGQDVNLALMTNETVEAWGFNNVGDLGNGETEGPEHGCPGFCSDKPVPVKSLHEVYAVAAGARNGMALLDNGTVETWGDNSRGQLGDDSHENYSDVPVPVCAPGQTSCTSSEHELTGVVAIAAAGTNDLALRGNGTIVGWGDNQWGDLGTGKHNGPEACVTGACSRVPVSVKGITGKGEDFATAIASESRHSLALLKNETVMAWGSNDDSQLGDGSEKGPEECELVSGIKEACSVNPVPVSGLADVHAIAAGYASLALLANGTVMSWGRNDHGELGIGTFGGDSDVPVPVSGLHEVSIISGGYEHSLALGVG